MSNFGIFFATMASCIKELIVNHHIYEIYPENVMDEISDWCIKMYEMNVPNELLDGKERMLCEMTYQFYCHIIDLVNSKDITDSMADAFHDIASAFMPTVVHKDIRFFDELKTDESIPKPIRDVFSKDYLVLRIVIGDMDGIIKMR